MASRTGTLSRSCKTNTSRQADVDMNTLYAEGGFKNVFKGEYICGPAIGQPCVHKVFKSGAVLTINSRSMKRRTLTRKL
jgi:hypothetical protein